MFLESANALFPLCTMSYSNGAPAAGTAGSRSSKRELIDRVRYPNPIPQPPYPPKLVKISAEPSRYANPHFADRLASQHMLPVIVDAHAGMPIDLANFQYLWEGSLTGVVPQSNNALDVSQIDDADAFLLQDFASTLPSTAPSTVGSVGLVTSLHAVDDPAASASLAAAAQQRHAQALGPGAKSALAADDVTWLRRTEYLGVQRHAQQQVQKPRVIEQIDVSREAQLEKIEQSFHDAQKPMHTLRHPNKRGVKAVQVFDFLPDPETWATEYQVVRFVDHPGRVVNGVPQADPRLDVAILRPAASADGEQRVSYYLPAGEEVNDEVDAPMTLIDNKDVEEQNAKRLRKRRRTGRFPPSQTDENVPRSVASTAYKFSRDYVPKDTAETAHDVLVLTLDDGVPDPDPDHDVDPIRGVKRSADAQTGVDDDDDLFGADEDDEAPTTASTAPHDTMDVSTTLPAQSEYIRQRRSRTSKGKGAAPTDASDAAAPKLRAYYHRIGMRFTLRVWRSRFANNEKLRNRDRRYPGKWDAIVLSNRELHEREQLRALHARSQVDDVGDLSPYESSDDEAEEPDMEEEDVEDENKMDPISADIVNTSIAQQAQLPVPANPGPVVNAADDEEAQGADDNDNAGDDDDSGEDEDDDDSVSDLDEDEEGTVDGDEELAALRAELQDAGQDDDTAAQNGTRSSRSRRDRLPPNEDTTK